MPKPMMWVSCTDCLGLFSTRLEYDLIFQLANVCGWVFTFMFATNNIFTSLGLCLLPLLLIVGDRLGPRSKASQTWTFGSHEVKFSLVSMQLVSAFVFTIFLKLYEVGLLFIGLPLSTPLIHILGNPIPLSIFTRYPPALLTNCALFNSVVAPIVSVGLVNWIESDGRQKPAPNKIGAPEVKTE